MNALFYDKSKKRTSSILPSAGIFILSLVFRMLYFLSIKGYRIFPDSEEYINAAFKLADFKIHVARVPVYPLFIQTARHLIPWLSLEEQVYTLQAIISSIGMAILYHICIKIFNSRLMSWILCLFTSFSISVVNWDFLILTESLTIFLMLLLVQALVFYHQKPSKKTIVLTYVICFVLIFTKPFYVLFPVMLLIVFLFCPNMVMRERKEHFIVGAICAASIYGCVFLYSALNYSQNNYMGISPVSTVNKLGKILQYEMYDLGDNPKIIESIRQEIAETGSNDIEPVGFMQKYGLLKNNYAEVSKFTGDILKRHFFDYIIRSIKFVFSDKTLKYAVFCDYNWGNYKYEWPSLLFDSTCNIDLVNKLSVLFVFLAIELAATAVRILRKHRNWWLWLNIDFIILYQVIMSLLGAHGEYHRLIAPSYILIILALFNNIFISIKFIKNSILHKSCI